ncbi:hypothetical protein O0I10_003343 [Lichtheimia ornata]|uniref:Uncharacterized protein n=1 Tax=Lichtheimia ornata TaxID=688661 RepID=A0AAD7V902_9FUNG|nr:uncharacterized protein O0I10_003343 [Lichtheimia ornata]KAJ8661120.1 hypothetical protein O0I10_003343 [Lichtheimia ornata]
MKTERKDISALAANLRSADDRERYTRVISISQNLQRRIQDLSASRYRYRQPIFMEERRRHHNGNTRTAMQRNLRSFESPSLNTVTIRCRMTKT